MEMNIYAYKCKKCGHVQYPYRTLCRNCHKNEHADRSTGQLDIENPKIGMAVKGEVKVVRSDEYDKYLGMVFSKA
jgi:uncharacterized OB-fold protein